MCMSIQLQIKEMQMHYADVPGVCGVLQACLQVRPLTYYLLIDILVFEAKIYETQEG